MYSFVIHSEFTCNVDVTILLRQALKVHVQDYITKGCLCFLVVYTMDYVVLTNICKLKY